MVRNETAEVQALFQRHVVPSYGRFDVVLSHGSGSQVWDVAGKRYLDLGGGVAVNSDTNGMSERRLGRKRWTRPGSTSGRSRR